MFAPDFCNPAYREQALYGEALELFEPPFKGRIARETVQHSKQILGIVIAFGGQWPHATYMLPGGVTCPLTAESLTASLAAIDSYTNGTSNRCSAVIPNAGSRCARWPISSRGSMRTKRTSGAPWASSRALAAHSVLHQTGLGTPHLLSAGCYYDPEKWRPPFTDRECLQPAGFYNGQTQQVEPFRSKPGRRARALLLVC
jgi:hydrogenase large subunit